MQSENLTCAFYSRVPKRMIGALAFTLLVAGLSKVTVAESTVKSFNSPGQAAHALYEAVKSEDDAAIRAVLGAGPELTSSGDGATDKREREHFARKYEEMHRLVREPGGVTFLYIGAENWPFPIPLVAKNGKWQFDSDAGAQEMTARRIGENEIAAFHVCQNLGKTTQSSSQQQTTKDPASEFARKLAAKDPEASQPFQGYKFHIGSEQSAGVVLVAYPVEYRVSGVMTFVMLPGGSVYEKDLGPETAKLAPQINARPSGAWVLAQ